MSGILKKSECIEIVKRSFKGKHFEQKWIKSFTVDRITEGLVGFMGEYYKLNVQLENGAAEGNSRKLTYFVKSLPISNEFYRKECVDKGFIKKEAQLYANLLGDIQKYAPRKLYPECYYTRPDVLVLEDLSTQPLRHISTEKEVSIDFFKVVLKTQAHLHAASIAYELDTGVNIGEKFKDSLYELQLTMDNVWCAAGVRGIIPLAKMIPKYHGTAVEEFIAKKLYNVLGSACHLIEPSDVYRNVLCHRDVWFRNLFFTCDENDKPKDCLMIDFQLTRYSPPAIDVLYLIAMATKKSQRDIIYDECLEYYYNSFVEIMTEKGLQREIFSKEDFRKSCHRLKLAVLILKAICTPFLEMPDGLANKFREEESERFDYYLNVDRDDLFERIMATHPEYKQVIFEPVEELIEYLVKEYKL